MNASFSKLLLALGVAATLAACASLPGLYAGPTHASADRFSQIEEGLTQDEVRGLVGEPQSVGRNPRVGETLWTYSFTDAWGYRSEFGVDFDASGVVTETYSERLSD